MSEYKRWYEDCRNLADLIAWLSERGDIHLAMDCYHILKKPWHWTREFELMQEEKRHGEKTPAT